MDIKKKEFLNLTQENRDVMAYVNIFNTLSQYAPEEVATDAKKQERMMGFLKNCKTSSPLPSLKTSMTW